MAIKETATNYLTDIYRDLLTVSHGAYARTLPPVRGAGLLRRWWRALIHVGKTLKDCFLFRRKVIIGGRRNIDGKIWLLLASKNNLDALAPLRKMLKDSRYVAVYKKTLELGDFPRLSLHRQGFYWYKAPLLLIRLYPDYKGMLWRRLDEFLKAAGSFEAALGILRKHRPGALIFPNDHIPELRAFLWAARKLNIPTIYIQHASVSPLFPPLKFDLSLLEGRDSLEKYAAAGPVEGLVKLIGMPKFDHYLQHRNDSGKICRIGLCANWLDEQKLMEEVLQLLIRSFPEMRISFRPHPRDQRMFRLPKGIILSDPKKEPIFTFLLGQDAIIAGDTSTHLEAVLLNVMSFYMPFNSYMFDYYGYVEKGLVEYAKSPQALVELVRKYKDKKPEVTNRAKYFNAVIGTKNEGRSSELAVKEIRAFLEDNF